MIIVHQPRTLLVRGRNAGIGTGHSTESTTWQKSIIRWISGRAIPPLEVVCFGAEVGGACSHRVCGRDRSRTTACKCLMKAFGSTAFTRRQYLTLSRTDSSALFIPPVASRLIRSYCRPYAGREISLLTTYRSESTQSSK